MAADIQVPVVSPNSAAVPGDGYSIHLQCRPNAGPNPFYALPFLGMGVKLVMLVPHFIVLELLALWVGLLQLVLWIPVLFKGHYPDLGYQHVGGFLRWSARVYAFLFGLTDRYPPFTTQSEPALDYPVDLVIHTTEARSRLFAVPLLGIAIRCILLVPHLVVLSLLGYVVTSVAFGWLWFPVLFASKYPHWGHDLVASYVEWSMRVNAYMLGLADKYPPFEWDFTE